jgi:hypothetical protein
MTRIPVHSVDSAPEGRDALKALEAKFGKVLNIHGAMAHSPAVLEAGWSDAELTETSAVVALNLFTNYFNHLVQTDLDLPAAPAI